MLFILSVLVFLSCKEIFYNRADKVKDGIYYLENPYGEFLKVYCEYHAGYGYTFLSSQNFANRNRFKMDSILQDADTKSILFRFKDANNSQFNSEIRQLPNYTHVHFGLLNSDYTDYTSPYNIHLGPYLYLGTLPRATIHAGAIQGYVANGQSHTFINYDWDPNSYFAFYPNLKRRSPTPVPNCCKMFGGWMKGAVKSSVTLDEDFFYQHEEHLGGGAMGISRQLGINGVAPGVKFGLNNGKFLSISS